MVQFTFSREKNTFKLLADSQLAICEGVMNAYFKKGAHFSKYGGNKFERGGVNKVWVLSFKNLQLNGTVIGFQRDILRK